MKHGFTLIELMTVVGIMAMLGVAATSGYAALQRGMAERGAVAAVNALLRSAKERAKVDRVPTAVFFYNRLLREADADNNAIVVGEAVAVRRAGRVTLYRQGIVYDEFADFEHTYDVVDSSAADDRPSMKLWKFDGSEATLPYSLVADAVCMGSTIMAHSFLQETEDDMYPGEEQLSSNFGYELEAYGFKTRPGGTGVSWKNGDGYGFEFATIQLPHNFIFGQSALPSLVWEVMPVKAVYFEPTDNGNRTIEIYFCLPSSGGIPQPHHRAGEATSDESRSS